MSQQRPRKRCDFFGTPGGCRKNPCRFLHSAGATTNNSQPQRTNRSPSDGVSASSAQADTPKGTCRSFWTTGRCKFEFNCRYNHVWRDQPQRGLGNTPVAGSSSMPFMSEGGFSKLGSSVSDVFYSIPSRVLDPNEAHNALKRFLYDDFRFRKTFDVYAFLVPVMNANATSNLWTGEDGQLFLTTLATGNGILRINDIILWQDVQTEAGSSTTVLSFQRGYFPIVRFLASDFVVKSTLSHLVNALYIRVLENFEHFSKHLEVCLDAIIASGTFKESRTGQSKDLSGAEVFSCLSVVLFECLSRFKNAVATYPRLPEIVGKLEQWTSDWVGRISKNPPDFEDVLSAQDKGDARLVLTSHLQSKVDRLTAIIDREQAKAARRIAKPNLTMSLTSSNEGIIAALHTLYEGPGELRKDGPRHDNDFVDINDIRVAPTQGELICRMPPFLPANLHEAPHHLPQESMERIQDIQYRLLREELTAPLRISIQHVRNDLLSKKPNTQLAELFKRQGGKYKGFCGDGQDGVLFNVYTNVHFVALIPDRRGLSAKIRLDTPPGKARSPRAAERARFWEGIGGKRFMQGGLVGLVWRQHNEVDIHLGVIASSPKEITDSAKISQHQIEVRVVFFDTSIELRILSILKFGSPPNYGQNLLIESPVMFEAIRPFLEAIRAEPEAIPFKEYLVHRPRSFFSTCQVLPPRYARMPGFHYQLAPLFPPELGVTDLKLVVSDPQSVEHARIALAQSRLDPSQATAVIDSLVREVALIQGPPGTGKSFVGIELLRVLVNSATPILMIAFTNHALDHLLSGVLDANITKKIVRLGSRSADERVSQYSIEALETVAGRNSSRLSPLNRQAHHNLKAIEKDIDDLMKEISRNIVTSKDILDYLEMEYPEHHYHLNSPPEWIGTLQQQGIISQGDGWTRVTRGRGDDEDEQDESNPYGFWKRLEDIEFLSSIPPVLPEVAEVPSIKETDPAQGNRFDLLQVESSLEEEEEIDLSELDLEEWQISGFSSSLTPPESAVPATPPKPEPIAEAPPTSIDPPLSHVELFLRQHGFDAVPPIPRSQRAIDTLLDDGNVWDMSAYERVQLDRYWKVKVGEVKAARQETRFTLLRERHRDKLEEYNQCKEEVRRQLLKDVDIVGCTTTGAARLGSLLKALGPRILLVEEAGQVLEAHVLGSLVPSIEHMILIGDPLQLRPTLNNYSLSMDSKEGSQLYRFDMSLMERLSSSGFPMSQIDVQRRMRPSISSLIRNTLYPKLLDNDLVKNYPDVRGLSKNVFFLDHQHPENGGVEEGGSRYNTYEVEMIRDLVLYLLRQGCYSQEGDIVVLCAYLGQLAKVRDALRDQVAVVIDERDQADLALREDESEVAEGPEGPYVEHVKVSQRVRLRTVDNYQGEEAKIVILSLVRNAGSPETHESNGHRPTIGFLKSENRTNVALSRAKEGLFILGNRALLASRSRMWRTVLEELEQNDFIGNGFPVACFRHPEFEQYISKPGELPSVAPDGGCLQPCDARLECGHVCPYKCHPDDPNHIAVRCMQACTKLCSRRHPCNKSCSDQCGLCTFKIHDVELPCGHRAPYVLCYQMDILEEVVCTASVEKVLPSCEHSVTIACSLDPTTIQCSQVCSGVMECCGRSCKARCSECQGLNDVRPEHEGVVQRIERKKHKSHPCERLLYCAHRCGIACSANHECTRFCKHECRQECVHSKCKQNCSSLCSPCKKPCSWKCTHYQCPVPCGSVCVRMPCDQRCETILECGHRCPSVCGEPCIDQACPICSSLDTKEAMVDFFDGRTLADIPPNATAIEDLIITLPKCHHTFTVETLDGICRLKEWYTFDELSSTWIGLSTPDLSSEDARKPPLCPTCRTAITARRYGRPYKSADLEILEKNVISRMTSDLAASQKIMRELQVENLESALRRGVERLEKITSTMVGVKNIAAYEKGRRTLLANASARSGPVPPYLLNPAGKTSNSTPSSEIVLVWMPTVQCLTNLLHRVDRIANTRPAHIHAWESAFTYVYNQEIDIACANPETAPRRPEEYAMRMARMKVGQPQPRSDKRFLVEAIWMSIQIRFTLASLVIKLIESMGNRPAVIPKPELQVWAAYGKFILDTCKGDAVIASNIARDCEAHRLLTKSQLYILRCNLQRFQYTLDMTKRFGSVLKNREELLETLAEQKTIIEDTVIDTTERHLQVLKHDRQWFDDNFSSITTAISDEWEKLERSIRLDTFYQEVSLDEKMAIVKAFNFSHAGHWYNCPNGHTYVIDDCGGAMVRSRCPDCGETIGGSNHREDATNTVAADYVRIAQDQGAGRSMWHR